MAFMDYTLFTYATISRYLILPGKQFLRQENLIRDQISLSRILTILR